MSWRKSVYVEKVMGCVDWQPPWLQAMNDASLSKLPIAKPEASLTRAHAADFKATLIHLPTYNHGTRPPRAPRLGSLTYYSLHETYCNTPTFSA